MVRLDPTHKNQFLLVRNIVLSAVMVGCLVANVYLLVSTDAATWIQWILIIASVFAATAYAVLAVRVWRFLHK